MLPSVIQFVVPARRKAKRRPHMPGRWRHVAMISRPSGAVTSKASRIAKRCGCAFTASAATSLHLGSQLGGWMIAESTPASSMSRRASAAE
jgi:hypothetical protein